MDVTTLAGKPLLLMGWVLVTAGLAGYGTHSFEGDRRRLFLPGTTTDGHYQIELACETCHTEAFADRDAIQAACLDCHAEALRKADDSHPVRKFTDPRNAARVEELDARYCVTCHAEHRPDATLGMGLTMPADYCERCHAEVGEERPTHRGLAFDSCASAGCHNFHDNRGLYEDFLLAHAEDPPLLASASVPVRIVERGRAGAAEGPEGFAESAHAAAGTGCAECHGEDTEAEAGWVTAVDPERCGACHERALEGFMAGRHGMRLAAGLSPMSPSDARRPMRSEASHRELSCTSCHGAHRFDTTTAAYEACIGCHADEHSRAFSASPHFEAFEREVRGEAPRGSGVSCATCHMPRVAEGDQVAVVHDQNENLRPSEKMLRSVCLDCHGLGFSIDALADSALVNRNFRGSPALHVESIAMAERRRDARSPRGREP